jgi:hypothetical protein
MCLQKKKKKLNEYKSSHEVKFEKMQMFASQSRLTLISILSPHNPSVTPSSKFLKNYTHACVTITWVSNVFSPQMRQFTAQKRFSNKYAKIFDTTRKIINKSFKKFQIFVRTYNTADTCVSKM